MLLQLLQRVPRGLGSPCAARCRLCFSIVSLCLYFCNLLSRNKKRIHHILLIYTTFHANTENCPSTVDVFLDEFHLNPAVSVCQKCHSDGNSPFSGKPEKYFWISLFIQKRKNTELFINKYMILIVFQSERETLYQKSFPSGVTRPSIPLPSPPLSVSPQSTAFTRQPCLFCFGYGGLDQRPPFYEIAFIQNRNFFCTLKTW